MARGPAPFPLLTNYSSPQYPRLHTKRQYLPFQYVAKLPALPMWCFRAHCGPIFTFALLMIIIQKIVLKN